MQSIVIDTRHFNAEVFGHITTYACMMYVQGDEMESIYNYVEEELMEKMFDQSEYLDEQERYRNFMFKREQFMSGFSRILRHIEVLRFGLNDLYSSFNLCTLNVTDKTIVLGINRMEFKE